MYALRERRVHVTQEDFELAVAKVNIELSKTIKINISFRLCKKIPKKMYH
jgi:ATP-dependent 26S proteasome regulatory subunit